MIDRIHKLVPSKSVEMIGEGPAQTKGIGIDTYVIERKRLGAS